MIESLKIKNFRSIQDLSIDFSNSGLNVIIGANGTGKSNIVKALEFISQLQDDNLASAIASQHGHNSIIPKALSNDNLENVVTGFEYTIPLPAPFEYIENKDRPRGSHKFSFQWEDEPNFSIIDESITYTEPLAVAFAINKVKDDEDLEINKKLARGKSTIKFSRRSEGAYIQTWPAFNKETREAYLSWLGLGLPAIEDEIESAKELNNILKDISQRFKQQGQDLTSSESLLHWDRSIVNFSAQSGVFKNTAKNIKRFDLQLAELRKEQQVNRNKSLLKYGSNLPTAVRSLQSSKTSNVSWSKLLDTIKEIAPHVIDIQTQRLKTGRDYVEFLETKTGRPVESWDSSDGTLRALAVLLAVESMPEFGTVILEEPEIGLHPWAIRYMMDHIQDAISRKNIQVIITTHSEQILESASTNEVFLTTRDKEKGTSLSPLEELTSSKSINKGEIGRLWVKGLLGGTP